MIMKIRFGSRSKKFKNHWSRSISMVYKVRFGWFLSTIGPPWLSKEIRTVPFVVFLQLLAYLICSLLIFREHVRFPGKLLPGFHTFCSPACDITHKKMKLGNDRSPGSVWGLDFSPCPGQGNQNNWPGATDCYFRVRFVKVVRSSAFTQRAIGAVRNKKEGMLLQPLRWCCVDCVIHHERHVREEQHHTYMWCEQAIIEWSWRVISGDTDDVNDWM